MLFDSHAHLTSSELYPAIHEVLTRAENAGVKKIINICTDEEHLKKGIALSEQYKWIHNAAAVHPHDAEKFGNVFFPIVEKNVNRLLAIGETGLDYHYQFSQKSIQQEFLRLHIQLAKRFHLPILIHCREAFEDFFEIFDSEGGCSGILHCFTGTMHEAEEGLKRGLYLSFSGVVTFKKSTDLRDVVRKVPLDKLLIETDAPYLAPQSKRGKVNEPAFIVETAEVVAALKEVSLQQLAEVSSQNAYKLFKSVE